MPLQLDVSGSGIDDDRDVSLFNDIVGVPRVSSNRTTLHTQVFRVGVVQERLVKVASVRTTVVNDVHASPFTIPRIDEPEFKVNDGSFERTRSLGAVDDQVIPSDGTTEDLLTSAFEGDGDWGELVLPVEESEFLEVGRRSNTKDDVGFERVEPQTEFTQSEGFVSTGLIESRGPLKVDVGERCSVGG